MAIGQKMTIKIHEDSTGAVVFDSVTIVEFTHVAGFAGATTVVKNDFTGSANDAFIVQITTDSTAPFATTLTVAAITALAKNAVNAVFGNGEAGAPT
jgi:hypothetical protein